MKITVNPLSKKNVNDAIKRLKQYEKEFLAKEAEFIRQLKEVGVSVATTGFELADYDGVNDVLIAETQNKSRALVIAYGKTVGFIEFGTGERYPEWVDNNNAGGSPYTPPPHGSYGDGKGANPHGWWFNQSEGASARHTYGNQPAEAMLTARDVMIEKITEIAREVWK